MLESIVIEKSDIEKNDYKRLNDFKNEEFENIKIDWDNVGDGISID